MSEEDPGPEVPGPLPTPEQWAKSGGNLDDMLKALAGIAAGGEVPPPPPPKKHWWNRKKKDPNRATDDSLEDQDVEDDALTEKKFLAQSRREEIEQRKFNRKMQGRFFVFAVLLVSVPVVISAIGFTWLIVTDRMTDTIAAAFFASVVGEVIGLSMILGKYLFPENGMSTGAGEKRRKSGKQKKGK